MMRVFPLQQIQFSSHAESSLLSSPVEVLPSIEVQKVIHSRDWYKPTDPDKDRWKHEKPAKAMDVDRLLIKGTIRPNKQFAEDTPFLLYINRTPSHSLAFVRLKNGEEERKQHICFEKKPLSAPWRLLSYSKDVSQQTLYFLTQYLFSAIDVITKALPKR
jgi:hypothetical protein